MPLPRALFLIATPLLVALGGCQTPSGEYGGDAYRDPSGPYGIQGGPVVQSETVGTGFDPFGGVYNYEEIKFGPPSQ